MEPALAELRPNFVATGYKPVAASSALPEGKPAREKSEADPVSARLSLSK